MADKDRMCCQLSERVLRQYDCVQIIPLPLTMIADIEPTTLVATFMEFVVHVLSQQESDPVREDEVWKHSVGYMN